MRSRIFIEALSIHRLVGCFVCSSVHPSVRPSIHPSIRPSIRPSVCPSVHPSIYHAFVKNWENNAVWPPDKNALLYPWGTCFHKNLNSFTSLPPWRPTKQRTGDGGSWTKSVPLTLPAIFSPGVLACARIIRLKCKSEVLLLLIGFVGRSVNLSVGL